MSDILVIIPAFNEEANIEQVVENLIIHHSELDYVIVNDGSTDATAKICRDKNYNMIDLPINLGLAGAFRKIIAMLCNLMAMVSTAQNIFCQ